MPSVIRARVFRSGNSQVVRLPKQFRFCSPMVEIYRRGEEVILRERKATLEEASTCSRGCHAIASPAGAGTIRPWRSGLLSKAEVAPTSSTPASATA